MDTTLGFDDLLSLLLADSALQAADLCPGRPEVAAELERRAAILRRMNSLAQSDTQSQVQNQTWSRPGSGSTTGSDSSLPLPQIPGYDVERELDRGGMGVVYLARQTGLNRPVALKLVLDGHASDDPRRLIRFLAEAEAVAAVQHPNVVQVYEYGGHAGRPFLALEYCVGGSLADLAKPLPARGAAELVAKIARGVQAAHVAGIVHRDLKPGNVLLDGNGEPKVTDFGLAKRAAGADLTQTQARLGTPAYMAPEQARGQAKFVGPPADVWALGVILYELLAGRRPFQAQDTWQLLSAVMEARFEPVRKVAPEVPRDLALICQKCLSREPHHRYPTATELVQDLDRFLTGRAVSVRPLSAVALFSRWAQRNPALAAAAGVTLALGLVTVASVAANYLQAVQQVALTREAQSKAEQLAETERNARIEADRLRADAEAALEFTGNLFRASNALDIFGQDFLPLNWEQQRNKTAGVFLQDAANALHSGLADQPIAKAKLLTRVGASLKNMGLFTDAEAALTAAEALRQKHLPASDPAHAVGDLEFGRLRVESGDFPAAIRYFERALDHHRRHGAPPADVLEAQFFLATGQTMMLDPKAAESFAEVAAARAAIHGPTHPLTTFARFGQVTALLNTGRPNEVTPAMIADVVAGVAQAPPGQLRDMGEFCAKFQSALLIEYTTGNAPPALAEPARRRAASQLRNVVARSERVLPADHAATNLFRAEYARVLARLGDDAAADALFAETVASIRRGIGLAHPKVLILLDMYAPRLVQAGRLTEATALWAEVDAANLARFGPGNFNRCSLLLHRAKFTAEQAQYTEAGSLAQEACELIRTGRMLPSRQAALEIKRLAESIAVPAAPPDVIRTGHELYTLCRPIVEQVFGPDTPEMVIILTIHGNSLVQLGDPRHGYSMLQDAEAVAARLSKPLPKDHRLDLLFYRGRAELYRSEWATAERYLRQFLELARRSSDPMDRIHSCNLLAAALTEQGKFAEALTLVQDARQAAAKLKSPRAVLRRFDRAATLLRAANAGPVQNGFKWLPASVQDLIRASTARPPGDFPYRKTDWVDRLAARQFAAQLPVP